MAEDCKPCEIGSNSLFGRIIGDGLIKSNKDIYVDGIDTVAVVNELPDGNREVTFNYSPYAAPKATFSVSPSSFEVGDTVPTATFTLNVTKGSADINSISVVPDPGISLAEGANQWTVSNVTSNVASNSVAQHVATIVDDTINPDITTSASLSARWRYYQGFSTKTALNETDIKALVNTSVSTGIKTLYGGNNTYTVPASVVNQFIYWAYPEGTNGIQSLTSGGFVVPFVVTGTVPVTNAFGITQNYIVVRTANALGSGDIQINMN